MITCTFENGNKASLRHVIIDALVLKENKILLVKRAEELLEGNKWALPGGFVDRDETIKQTVEREVFEETGWEIADITFLRVKDSPKRKNEDRQNIGFVFYCRGLEKIGEPDHETADQKWHSFNSLPSDLAFDHLDDINYYLNKRGEKKEYTYE